MKRLILLPIIFLIFEANAQLTANAGEDTTICVGWNFTDSLDFGATASGGTTPYSFLWETNYYHQILTTTYHLTAADFLSDTTISNPNLIHTVEDPVTFKLTVTDALGEVAVDTIVVSFSIFNTHLVQYNHSMLLGDSVEFVSLPNVGGGTPPLTYLWQPNNGLTDSISYTNFWVKPDQSTEYYITVTDAVGCVFSGAPVFTVYIGYASLNEVNTVFYDEFIAYPNPFNNQLHLKVDIENVQVVNIFSESGFLLKQFRIFDEKEIDVSDLSEGIYFVEITIDGNTKTKRFVKKN